MNLTDADLDALLKRLNLANTRRIWSDLAVRAETGDWSYRQFLETLIGEEVAHRQRTRLSRCTYQARFPFLKTIDDFDFQYQSQLRLSLLGSYLTPDFVTEGRSLVLYGRSGRGKTHLAVAVAYRAIQNGFEALFTTAAALIDDLSRASRDGRFRDALARYARVHVLVIDEVGYLHYGPDAANVLFHLVNERHLAARPMIFTTNKPLAAWGEVLHDPDLAEAIVDRILERGRFLVMDGPSLRTRHIHQDHLSDPARLSGKSRPEFPELTWTNSNDGGTRRQRPTHLGTAGFGRWRRSPDWTRRRSGVGSGNWPTDWRSDRWVGYGCPEQGAMQPKKRWRPGV